MSENLRYLDRITYSGDLESVLEKTCLTYSIGTFQSYKTILTGYEDLNLKVKTNKGNFLIKILASFRNEENISRLENILLNVTKANIKHPNIYKQNDHLVYKQKENVSVIVMDYVDGQSLYQEQEKLVSEKELRFLAQEAAKINKIQFHPGYVQDTWSCYEAFNQYEQKKKFLDNKSLNLITDIVDKFKKIQLNKLPHCFVHGDIIKTNVLRDKTGNLFIIDFSVSNWYPRIQELAVLMSNIFFDTDKNTTNKNYQILLEEYQKYIPLTELEKTTLPTYINMAHGMHVLCATAEREQNNNISKENEYWIKQGLLGLER